MPEPVVCQTAGGDWWTGVGASYVPCPNDCGRMVADTVQGRAIVVRPCLRCQRLALMERSHDA